MGSLFGTDGVRGLANRDITAELALRLSVAAAHVLSERVGTNGGLDASDDQLAATASSGSPRPVAVVGRDPRASGEFLQAAVVAGLAAAGVDVHVVDILPTPGVAYLTGAWDADLGVMLSASHNPMPDNGIKFFARGGHKLPDEVEDEIERWLTSGESRDLQFPIGDGVGRVVSRPDGAEQYVQHLVGSIDVSLNGLRLVVDCANGAASVVGPQAYERAGAVVTAIHDDPDGLNINDGCGSTHLEQLQEAVVAAGADLGLAHDGDADRCLAVDATGAVVDGDHMLAILAPSMMRRGLLPGNTVVGTVMANMGLEIALQADDVTLLRTGVGDRYVLEQMRAGGFTLGGEQSGHIVLTDYATTGDGVLTGLQLMAEMVRQDASLAQLAEKVERLPQVLVNVSGVDRSRVDSDATVAAAVRAAEDDLGSNGRVLLRPSGTEPLVRVMVEATDAAQADAVAARLAEVVRTSLSL